MSEFYAKIVIIGAGISGLGAMVHLKSNGIEDVLVLEARCEVGGRIKSIPYGISTRS